MKKVYYAIAGERISKGILFLYKPVITIIIALVLVIAPVFNAGAGIGNKKHKKTANQPRKKNIADNPTPSVSYAGPQTYTAGRKITPLVPASANISPYGYTIGDLPKANADILNLSASISGWDMVADAAGNFYVSQPTEVDKIDHVTGNVTVVASGFTTADDLAIDAAGNLYVTDYGTNQVIKVPAGTSNRIAIGTGIANPRGIAVDASGNVYVAEFDNNDVKKILAGTNTTTVFATGFNGPAGLAFDASGNLYVANFGGGDIIKVRLDGGLSNTYATLSGFGSFYPVHIAFDNAGTLFMDYDNSIDLSVGVAYKFAASNTAGVDGSFILTFNGNSTGFVPYSNGKLYCVPSFSGPELQIITPEGGYFIDKKLPAGMGFDPNTGIITGEALSASPSTNYPVTAYYATNADSIPVPASTMVNIAVNMPAAPAISYPAQVYPVNVNQNGTSPVSSGGLVGDFGYQPTASVIGSGFNKPNGVAKDAAGNLYIADRGNNLVKKRTPGGTITTVGSGFSKPTGVAVDAAGNIFVADNGNNAVKKIPAGSNTPAVWGSGFSAPLGIAVDAAGNVYVADKGNNAVKKISTAGVTTTLESDFNGPSAVAVDAAGSVYVAETGTGSIKRILAGAHTSSLVTLGIAAPFGVAVDAGGIVYAIGQSDQTIYKVDTRNSLAPQPIGSEFNSPEGIMVDIAGNIYIADTGNNQIREVTPTGGYFLQSPLPTGLFFSDATGLIGGLPTTITPAANYTVTAYNPAGSTTNTFSLKVVPNALLASIAISSGTLSPAFKDTTYAYTDNVTNATTSVTVTPTVLTAGSSISVNNVSVASGTASAAIPLVVGPNVITVTGIAGDGVTTQPYTITVARAPSVVADLAHLTTSAGTLSPAFATGTTNYTASVSNATASIKLTPTAADATATIKINGIAVASGNASASIALKVGKDTINTVVTAQDGTTIKTYTLIVTRISNNALLTSIATTPVTLLNTISGPGYVNYSTTVPHITTSIQVTAVVQDTTARIKINGVATASGVLSAAIPLIAGDNTINTVVTAQDGTTIKNYIITVTRDPSTNANLGNLVISAGTLSPAFSTSTLSYTAQVGGNVASITVTPTVADAATVKVNTVAVTSGTASAPITLNTGANTINIALTAQDGITTKTYALTVTRSATGSSNAVLTQLKANPSASLTVVSGADYKDYTTTVPNTESSVQIIATAQDATATIKVNGVTVASGTASAPIALNAGANVINTVVTAQDGVTQKTYSIKFTRQPSVNAGLAGLTLSSGILSPVFATGTISYTAAVSNTTASVTITPVTSDGGATVKINGATVASGAASGSLPLVAGPNTITAVVTAQDGITTKTYTITITRAVSTNAVLSQLKVTPSTSLTVVSGADYKDYTTTVPNTEAIVQITPTAQDTAATIKVNGVTVPSGTASASIPLNIGDNVISTVVTAQDGVTTKTYSIKFTRQASANASLAGLTLSSGTLAPVFATGTTGYTAAVSNATVSVTVTPVASGAGATIRINGSTVASGSASASLPLVAGPNTITAVVTAQDGITTKTYTVTITRAASTNAVLTQLKVTPATSLTVVTGADYRDYTTTVPNTETSVQITPAAQDATATIKVNGVTVASGTASGAIPLNVGDNIIKTVVTAQDGITVKTYGITFTRQAPAGEVMKYEPQESPIAANTVTVRQNVSPNGDGNGDILIIDGIAAYPDNKVQIMNRNGVLVYEAKGYNNETKVFDGHSSSNGKLQQAGTYMYSLEYKDGNETKRKTGFIVLKY